MFRNDHGRVCHVTTLFGLRDHLRLGQRDLSGKDLHALNAHSAVAALCGGQFHHGIGPGGVILLQGKRAGRRLDGDIGGIALCVGGALDGKAVAGHGDEHALDGAGLPCTVSLNA